MARDYRKEYLRDHASEKDKKDRASRNAARREMKERLGAAAIEGKDVNHKDQNPRHNSTKNLTVESPAVNRARKKKR